MGDKSIVVFTSFWEADAIIKDRYFLFNDTRDNKLYRIILQDGKSVNYSVHSIALSHPDLSKNKNMKGINRIDCFCPTYDLLKKYKENKDWAAYTEKFIGLMKNRKSDIKDWANSLKTDHVYFLCCWENTTNGAHCHRELVYNAFFKSKIMSEKILPIYMHGGKKVKKEFDTPFVDLAFINNDIRVPRAIIGVGGPEIVRVPNTNNGWSQGVNFDRDISSLNSANANNTNPFAGLNIFEVDELTRVIYEDIARGEPIITPTDLRSNSQIENNDNDIHDTDFDV